MKVILLNHIEKLGKKGEVVSVKEDSPETT